MVEKCRDCLGWRLRHQFLLHLCVTQLTDKQRHHGIRVIGWMAALSKNGLTMTNDQLFSCSNGSKSPLKALLLENEQLQDMSLSHRKEQWFIWARVSKGSKHGFSFPTHKCELTQTLGGCYNTWGSTLRQKCKCGYVFWHPQVLIPKSYPKATDTKELLGSLLQVEARI